MHQCIDTNEPALCDESHLEGILEFYNILRLSLISGYAALIGWPVLGQVKPQRWSTNSQKSESNSPMKGLSAADSYRH